MTTDALPILIGQYDSPFVRRVAIAMSLYEMPFEHRPWSVFRDAEQISTYNPLRRVPTLVFPSGEALIDSTMILDALDDQVEDTQVMMPRRGPERRAGLRVCALACGMADKGVALVYETVLREADHRNTRWVKRCSRQIKDALDMLERERRAIASDWWLGNTISHADIAVVVALHFLKQGAKPLMDEIDIPGLDAMEQRCGEMEVFQTIDQPLNVPS